MLIYFEKILGITGKSTTVKSTLKIQSLYSLSSLVLTFKTTKVELQKLRILFVILSYLLFYFTQIGVCK